MTESEIQALIRPLADRIAALERHCRDLEQNTVGSLKLYRHPGSLRERIVRLEEAVLDEESEE